MKKVLTFCICLLLISGIHGQINRTTYYANAQLDREVPLSKARFSETITNYADGTVTTALRNIKEDKLMSCVTYKGNEPVGVWKTEKNGILYELDYNFEVVYSDVPCSESTLIPNALENNSGMHYEAPVISLDETTIYHFIFNNIFYPDKTRLEGIQGKVILTFNITEKGAVENIAVLKGRHISLDKEAMRVIRMIRFLKPPILDGKPNAFCATLPIVFKLE